MLEKKYILNNTKNKKVVEDYEKYLRANVTDNKNTLYNHIINITKVLSILNKDYDRITPNDLDNVFSNIENSGTRELAKIKFKRFLKYKKLKKLANHIKINSKYFKKPTKTDNDILSEYEIKQLRSSRNTIRDLAIAELILTTGISNIELCNLKLQNIEFLKDEIKVKITKGKTPYRPRNISIIPYLNNPIAFYPEHFISYYNNHSFKNQPNKPLFYSMSSNTKFEPLVEQSLSSLLKKIGRNAELDKKVTPHILRHTAATHDGYHLTEQELRIKYGWKPGSDMPKRYCHLNEVTFNGKLKQKAGLTPEIIEKESKCPFCNHTNNINAILCNNCKRIINKEEMAKRIEEQDKREKTIDDQLRKYEKDIKSLESKIKEYHDETSKVISALIVATADKLGIDLDAFNGEVNTEIKKDGVYISFNPNEDK